MPRRIITLTEAAEVFARHGLKVKVEAVEDMTASTPDIFATPEQPQSMVGSKVGPKHVKITLAARHSIGCGGYTTKGEGTSANRTLHYGPGRDITVPVELAAGLLHADAQAKAADADFLCPYVRSYVVGARRDSSGKMNYVGIPVTDEQFANFTNLSNFQSLGGL